MTMNVAVVCGGGFQGQGIVEAVHAIEGGRAVVFDATYDAPAQVFRQSALELLDLRSGGDPSGAQDFDDAGDGVFVDGGFGEGQVSHLFVLTIVSA